MWKKKSVVICDNGNHEVLLFGKLVCWCSPLVDMLGRTILLVTRVLF